MMKKLWIAALLGLMLALSGCGGEKAEDAEEDAAVEEGQYKIEIFTAESTAVPCKYDGGPDCDPEAFGISGVGTDHGRCQAIWCRSLDSGSGKK